MYVVQETGEIFRAVHLALDMIYTKQCQDLSTLGYSKKYSVTNVDTGEPMVTVLPGGEHRHWSQYRI